MQIEIKNRFGDIIVSGDYISVRQACEENKTKLFLADLSGADLSGADLYQADLYQADLSGANLFGADLYRANLSGADRTLSDNQKIKFGKIITTLSNRYHIIIATSHIEIGCKLYTADQWDAFSDDEIAEMDARVVKWWHIWKPIILSIYNTGK
jgi:hypothetical protein